MKYNIGARVSWKYGTHLAVSGTPWFKANGVAIDGAENFDYPAWINFLKQFVSIPKYRELILANKIKRVVKVNSKFTKPSIFLMRIYE